MANAVKLKTIIIDAGADWSLPLFWVDANDSGIVISDAQSEIRASNEKLLCRLTVGSGITLDSSTGGILLEIDDVVTKTFAPGSYAWDLFANIGSARYRLLFADVLVRKAVTSHG